MTLGGWITFLLVTSSVLIFFVYSMYKVITSKKVKKIHNVYDVDIEEK